MASFDVSAVNAEIAATPFHDHLVYLPVTASTNTLALEAAHRGARTGVWVADEQTAGRGRGGNSWHSAPGDGLYVSVLATPRIPLSRAHSLPIHTGLAVRSAVKQVTGLVLDIRWPNDLLFGDAKCGGILVESASESSGRGLTLRYAVIGVGLNVNQTAFPPELASLATSLFLESGRAFDREPILSAILRKLHAELELLEGGSTQAEGAARLAAASSWVQGKQVRVGADEHGRGGYTGWTRGLSPDGFLRVEGDDGILHTVVSGGVRSFKD